MCVCVVHFTCTYVCNVLLWCTDIFGFDVFTYKKDFISNMFRYIVLTTYLLYIIYNKKFIFNIFSYHNVKTKSY